MRPLSFGMAALAAISLAACAAPTATTGQTAAATRPAYQDPDTGSLFGGNEHPDLGSGYHDPSMGNLQHASGGGK